MAAADWLERALKALEDAGIVDFRVVEGEPEEGSAPVRLVAPEGDFDGVEGIKRYATSVASK